MEDPKHSTEDSSSGGYEAERQEARHRIRYNVRGSSLITALILIVVGVLFLLNNFGLVPWSVWNNLWQFWPLILILMGIEGLLGSSLFGRFVFTIIALAALFLVLWYVGTGHTAATVQKHLSLTSLRSDLNRALGH